MPYPIHKYDGTLLVNLQDNVKDTETTSLTLIGRGAVDYGEAIAENLVYMLESFAGPSQPANPIPGQTWFQTYDPGPPVTAINKLKVFNGSDWINVGGAASSVSPPENPEPGDLWYNPEDATIYYWDGYSWQKVGGPHTGLPPGTDPATIPDDVPIPPPENPQEGDIWWMLPERQLWAYDSSLATLSCFPPGARRVDNSIVPNGWILIGPQGIQDPNNPMGGSFVQVVQFDAYDPLLGEDVVAQGFATVLNGDMVSIAVERNLELPANNIVGFPFASWSDPFDTNANDRILQPGLNINSGAYMVFNGAASDAQRLNGVNAGQLLRSDMSTGPISNDIVYDLGSPEKHWLNFYSKYHFGGTSTEAAVDVSEVTFFGMASKAEICDTAETAKSFNSPRTLKTPTTADVEVKFENIFGTDAPEWIGTATLTQAGKDAVKAIAETVTNDVVSTLPTGSYVPLDASSVPTGQHDMGNSGSRWGTIYANVFDGEATKAKYADLAEKYHADAVYTPGTLLSIGGEKEVTITSGAFDNEYFGVVSTNPGFILNSASGPDSTHPPVALIGRVPVRVVGPVKKGQRIILSSTPGVAIGSQGGVSSVSDRYVVGRALETSDEQGERLVLCVVGK